MRTQIRPPVVADVRGQRVCFHTQFSSQEAAIKGTWLGSEREDRRQQTRDYRTCMAPHVKSRRFPAASNKDAQGLEVVQQAGVCETQA